jgi:predicted permease
MQDLKYALRAIRNTGWLSFAVVVTLAVGVGMNAVVFSIFNGLLFRANVTRDPASYVQLYAHVSGQWTRELDGLSTLVTLEDYEIIRDSASTLSAVTASRWASFALGEGDTAASLRGLFISCDYLAAHVGPMRLGRGLVAGDCAAPSGSPVVVLTERGWTLHFARDPNVIGRVVRLNDRQLTIVGVAPDDAVRDPVAALLYVPYTLQPVLRGPTDFFRAPHGQYAWLSLSGRLRRGRTLAEAQSEMQLLARQIDRLHPGQVTEILVTDGALIHEPDAAMPVIITLCLGTTLLMLMTVCANVGTLLLARAVTRRHEIAVRLSLGAGRGQLLRQLLMETVLLGGCAALVSLALAHALPTRLLRVLTDFPLHEAFTPDWRVFGFTFGVALVAGGAAGLSPALETLRVSVSSVLKPGGPGSGAPVSSHLRGMLIANQLSVSLALLIAMGLFVRAQERLLSATLDYDPQTLLIASIDLPHVGYTGPAARAFYDRLLPMLTSLPGVRAVALTSPPPFAGIGRKALRRDATSATVFASVRAVSPEYFSMTGVRLITGRLFTDSETRTTSSVMPLVVSESFARMMFPGSDALGRRVSFGNDAAAEIVGIVSDTTSIRPTVRDDSLIYQPMPAANVALVTPLLQFTGDARALSQAVRAAIQTIDPRLVPRPETIAATIAREATQYTTILKITAVPAGLALVLSLIGIYGVTMFAATQRTREIGIRIACGAGTRDVVMLFLHSLYKPFALGVAAGSILATVAILLLRWTSLSIDVSPRDPLVYLIAIVFLIATATVATVIPALRAARTQPWTALTNS